MLTVQQIQEMSFEKAVFGGYDMRAVDQFVEQIATDYGSMQKENAALKSKMKLLLEKVEEYRSVESDMRKTLLSAQNIAEETREKAQKESEHMLAATRVECEEKLQAFQTQIEVEAEKAQIAKKKTAELFDRLIAQCQKQLEGLQALKEVDDLQFQQEAEPSKAPQKAHGFQQAIDQNTRVVPNADFSKAVDDSTKVLPDQKLFSDEPDQKNKQEQVKQTTAEFETAPEQASDNKKS